MLSAPTSTAPAASIRSIRVASRGDGCRSRLIFDPARVESPCTSNRFFTANGTPASGPGFLPAAMAASIGSRLGAGAIGGDVGEGIQDRIVFCDPRQRGFGDAERRHPVAGDAPARFPRPTARRDLPLMAISGCKDTGRLGFVGQREFIDQPRQPQRHFEIGLDRRSPGVVDRQRQRLGRRRRYSRPADRQPSSSQSFVQCTGSGGCGIAVSSSFV